MMDYRHLHFVQSTEPLDGGGLGRAAWELSDALRLIGLKSSLVTTGGSMEQRPGLEVYSRFGPAKAFYAPALNRVARTRVAEAHVIHGHGFYVWPNWVFGREVRHQHKLFVYHVHGMFEPWILARSTWKKRIAHWLFEDANFTYAGLWRALTIKEADQIRTQGITAPIVVCPNGIELSTFGEVSQMRAGINATKSKRSLLFLARLHPKKGLDLLVSAWAAISKQLRAGWRIVIAGPDELNHCSEVQALARRLDVSADLEFVGEVSGEAKLRCLAEADAFVLPSRSEGFSVAILEAMACKLPVLATTACNFPELAQNGGGWCVEANVDGIKQGLVSLLGTTDRERAQRGDAARSLVEAQYTWPRIAATIDHSCRQLLT